MAELHLTNGSSRSLHGPGRRISMMAHPRVFELKAEQGVCPLLTPRERELALLQQLVAARRVGQAPEGNALETYRTALEQRWAVAERAGLLAPGRLVLVARQRLGEAQRAEAEPVRGPLVGHGDTLLCACSREEAAAGRCHRAWAAPFLVRAGWRVILDGKEVSYGG